ncbi:MAG: amidohydrolase [Desulfobacterales bacterium]|nr:MAG: amidohydrolase [Desulfobacterales bacterium]
MKQRTLKPDLILMNGDFRTQDIGQPKVKAVAIAGERILVIGEDVDIRALAHSDTRLIDLGGRLGLPGMMDSHFHYYDWALGRRQLSLSDVKSFPELIERVAQAVQRKVSGSWILGQGWNETDWPENRMPTRDDLDTVAPSHPVVLWRCDLHLAVANSMALEFAGIDQNTPDPPDGVIERDAAGRPNGILRELAANLIKAVITQPGDDELLDAMDDGIHHCHSLGLTGLHDARLMGGLEGALALNAWQRLNERGKLDLRCWVSLAGERLDEAVALGLRTGLGDDRLRIGHVKYFADGGMGARTAWMIEPYLDAEYGMPLVSMDELKETLYRADQAGLAVMIHAIGDKANREVISLFETLQEARSKGKNWPSPPAISHRMDHVQMIRPEDLTRLSKIPVVASVQPHNIILDINMIEASVGAKGKWTYAYRDMIDAGVPVLFSSDAPVSDPSPLVGIHAAVTRQRRDGTPEGGWHPSQRITVEEAVRGYTITPAMAYGRDKDMGSITPGKFADLIILDRNIYTVDPMEIAETRVEMTLFDGRIVYGRDTF